MGTPSDATLGDQSAPPADSSAQDVVPADTVIATDAAVAMPPPNSFRCGQGTVTADEMRMACERPITIGSPSRTVRCDGASATGARYEVWCPEVDGSSAYVFIEVLGATTTPSSCTLSLPDGFSVPVMQHPYVSGHWDEAYSGSGAGASSGFASARLDATPRSYALSASLHWGGSTGRAGGFRVFTEFSFDSCGAGMAPTQFLALAVEGTWDGRDR